jgi:hypothetical protein
MANESDVRTYDPEQCVFEIGGVAITGWDSAEVGMIEDKYDVTSSTEGLPAWMHNPNPTSEGTLVLHASSPHLEYVRNKVGELTTIKITDISGTQDSYTGLSARIIQQPRLRRAKEQVTWEVRWKAAWSRWMQSAERPEEPPSARYSPSS